MKSDSQKIWCRADTSFLTIQCKQFLYKISSCNNIQYYLQHQYPSNVEQLMTTSASMRFRYWLIGASSFSSWCFTWPEKPNSLWSDCGPLFVNYTCHIHFTVSQSDCSVFMLYVSMPTHLRRCMTYKSRLSKAGCRSPLSIQRHESPRPSRALEAAVDQNTFPFPRGPAQPDLWPRADDLQRVTIDSDWQTDSIWQSCCRDF